MQKITVLLADDHTIVRRGLRSLLQTENDMEVVAEAETGRQAVQLATALKPDVVLMDIAMPMLNGLEATRQILKQLPATRVLILSSYNDDEYVHELTEAGGAGYLLKQADFSDVVRAIREAKKGNAFYSPAISRRLTDRYRETIVGGVLVRKRTDLLTSREIEVLQLIAEGESNKQIAAELGISVKTVERHRQRLMDKLAIHDIAGLTRYAISRGLVEMNVTVPKSVLPSA
ncbi:MAG: DNA-binding response regulator [Acidobacteria bacterium]|nr:MAG: DNA-binding response regulator [Acidobacteriota bacterium]